jgi:hypothetical protein
VAGPATQSNFSPSTNLYKGRVWRDGVGTTRYYTGNGVWSTDPQALPFVVLTAPGTINGVSAPAGVYIDTAFIADATITNAKIGALAVDNGKIANLSVEKLDGAALKVGAFIQSTNFTSGADGAGWRINADGTAELQAAYIRGQLTATQINGNGLVIRDNLGNAILGVGTNLDRTVDQGVEVGSAPGAVALAGQGHEGLPAVRQTQHQGVGLPALPLHQQGHPGQGEEAMVWAEMAGAHRQLGGEDAPVNPQRFEALQL